MVNLRTHGSKRLKELFQAELAAVKTLQPGTHGYVFLLFCFSIRPPPELLPVMGPLERYITPILEAALLCSSRAGSDLGRTSD